MNINRILNHMNKYKHVSFDIFDTLLKRDVLFPVDVFDIVEKKFNSIHTQQLNFSKLRILAEKNARKKSVYQEVTLDEIYIELDLPEDIKNEFKKIELEIESRILHASVEIKDVYKRCMNDNKAIYLVSDMYLPKTFLEMILKREGFLDYKKLYLSCEYRAKKRTGELFEILCSKEGLDHKDLIHIGDSWYADFVGPLKKGIRAIHIPRLDNHTIYMSKPKDNSNLNIKTLFAFLNNRCVGFERREYQLGYEVLGPIIYSYCKWIRDKNDELNKDGRKKRLWFVARDMFLFHQAYELLYGYDSTFEYVYISRKSLRPVLTQVTEDLTESGNVFARGEYTLKEIIKFMGYTEDDLENSNHFDLCKKYNVRKLDESEEVKRAISSPRIIESEKELAQKGLIYLKSRGLFDNDIILADVGWHGTTQYILSKIQKKISCELNIQGLYLGCMDGTDEKIGKENYKTFIFGENSNSLFTNGIIVFEVLILAPHGSTVQYVEEKGEVIPFFGLQNNTSDYVSEVQLGAVDFVKQFKDCVLSETLVLTSDCVSEAFGNLAAKPQKYELDRIGEMDYDNFYSNKVADPKTIMFYLFHPKTFYTDFKYAPWRVGFMYKLFKIRLPYAKIYSMIRCKLGKQA